MSAHITWPWAALLLLGAIHGINPGMGWLFAVALGLQRRERRAVWGALLPLAGGHAVAVGVAAVVAALLGLTLSSLDLKWIVAACLFGVGIAKLVRMRHPRYGGMNVTRWQIGVWSFLMATAHGAGLMALPFLLAIAHPSAANVGMSMSGHSAHMVPASTPLDALVVALVHTGGYLLVTGVVAVIVYEHVGLRMLGRAWFNVDRLWAGALIVTGALTPLIA